MPFNFALKQSESILGRWGRTTGTSSYSWQKEYTIYQQWLIKNHIVMFIIILLSFYNHLPLFFYFSPHHHSINCLHSLENSANSNFIPLSSVFFVKKTFHILEASSMIFPVWMNHTSQLDFPLIMTVCDWGCGRLTCFVYSSCVLSTTSSKTNIQQIFANWRKTSLPLPSVFVITHVEQQTHLLCCTCVSASFWYKGNFKRSTSFKSRSWISFIQ